MKFLYSVFIKNITVLVSMKMMVDPNADRLEETNLYLYLIKAAEQVIQKLTNDPKK